MDEPHRTEEQSADADVSDEGAARGVVPANRRWIGLASVAVVYGLVVVLLFHEVWLAGIRDHLPVYPRAEDEASHTLRMLRVADAQWVATGVARNAGNLLADPAHVFDVGTCHPVPDALALGEPMLALGLVGAPVALFSDEPLVIFNVVVVAIAWLSGLAMFWLVGEWTASPVAGGIAGFLYAFLPLKTYNVVHPYVDDTLWTVLALLFARRWLARGGWGPALATSAFVGMQIAGSFYPLLAATFLALPLLVWLVVTYGVSRLGVAPAVTALGLIAAVAWFVLAPYLSPEVEAAGDTAAQGLVYLLNRSTLMPGGRIHVGAWLPALALVALLPVGRRGLAPGIGDPRWALLAAGLLVAFVSAAPRIGPVDTYPWLAAAVPGFDRLRAPIAIMSGAYLVACVLAGIAVAALERRAPPRHRWLVRGVLVALTGISTLSTTVDALPAPVLYEPHRSMPGDDTRRVAEALSRSGIEGAVLDVEGTVRSALGPAPALMVAALHGHRTSVCHASVIPFAGQELARLIERIDAPESTARLRGLGFEAVLVRPRGGDPALRRLAARIAAESTGPDPRFAEIARSPDLVAYRIRR